MLLLLVGTWTLVLEHTCGFEGRSRSLHRLEVDRGRANPSLGSVRLLGVGLLRCVEEGTVAVSSDPFAVEALLDSDGGLLLDDPINDRDEVC